MPDQLSGFVTLVLPREEAQPLLAGDALALFENEVLPAYLPQQRWFADKDTAPEKIRLVDIVALGDGTPTYLAICEIEQTQRMYFVPVAIADTVGNEHGSLTRATLARVCRGAREGLMFDAFATDVLPLAVLADVRTERRRVSRSGGTFAAHAAPALAALDLPAETAVRRLSVEQSNTSVVIGESVMLKGYRRVHRGPQPELEVARFLDAVNYANTPALIGYIEYEPPGSAPVALCILQRFVESQGDGWDATLAYLERYFHRRKNMRAPHRALAPAVAGVDDDSNVDEHAIFMQRARTLGRRTAELHRAFATPLGDAAFEPEPTTDDDVAAWVEQARVTAQTALATLERRHDRVPAELRQAAQALLARRDEIINRLTIPSLGTTAVLKTRYHGDFHLGQVLVVGDDFMMVDFEGEPGRDPAVRRLKSSPLRDVAGMLRSINYAAVAGLRGVAADLGEDPTALEPLARDWEGRSAAAFLDGYRATIAGCPSYPSDPGQAQRLLELFVLEKAFYEMSYELANRPSWLSIPLEGIRTILDAGQYALSVK